MDSRGRDVALLRLYGHIRIYNVDYNFTNKIKMKLRIKVIPSASRDRVVGWLGDELKVSVRAAPERGKANIAVEKLLAKTFEQPKKSVSVIAGKTSVHKVVEFSSDIEKSLLNKLM